MTKLIICILSNVLCLFICRAFTNTSKSLFVFYHANRNIVILLIFYNIICKVIYTIGDEITKGREVQGIYRSSSPNTHNNKFEKTPNSPFGDKNVTAKMDTEIQKKLSTELEKYQALQKGFHFQQSLVIKNGGCYVFSSNTEQYHKESPYNSFVSFVAKIYDNHTCVDLQLIFTVKINKL